MAKKPNQKTEDKSKNNAKSASKADTIAKKASIPTKDDSKSTKKDADSKTGDSKAGKIASSAIKIDAKPQTLKQAAKSKLKSKTKKNDKKQEDEIEDDLDDDFGESEIAEYEDDLKAVEDDEDDDNLDEFSEDDDSESVAAEIYLTDSEGRRLCRVRDCDQVAIVDGYCRYHYLLLWQKIQIRKVILIDDKLEKYIIALTTRYPDKFLEMIKKDLKTEKDFLSSIAELEIDESVVADEAGDDDAQSFTDEIRGTVESTAMDDDGDY